MLRLSKAEMARPISASSSFYQRLLLRVGYMYVYVYIRVSICSLYEEPR